MAYTVRKNPSNSSVKSYRHPSEGPKGHLSKLARRGWLGSGREQAEFYEIEPAIIHDILTEDHPKFESLGGYSMIGAVKFQLLYSPGGGQSSDTLPWAIPLSGNQREYPLVGELVEIVFYLGVAFYHKRINYMNTVNGSISFDFGSALVQPGGTEYKKAELVGPRTLIKGEEKPGLNFYENYFIQPLKMSEGDITYEGRLGQTLRLGHMAREDGEDPYQLSNIKLRLGQLTDAEANDRGSEKEDAESVANKPIDEHINDDGCSLWMTLGEEVQFAPGKPTEQAESLYKTLPEAPDLYDGKQIILNSDRIIFNTKAKELMCFSKGDMYFSSTANYVIDTDKDFLMNNLGQVSMTCEGNYYIQSQARLRIDGVDEINFGDEKGELIVKGETLIEVLNDLIDAIKKSISPSGAIAGPFPVSLVNPSYLDAVSSKLNSFLSEKVTTV